MIALCVFDNSETPYISTIAFSFKQRLIFSMRLITKFTYVN